MNCLVVILSLFLIWFPLFNANQLNFSRRIYESEQTRNLERYPFLVHLRSKPKVDHLHRRWYTQFTGVLISKKHVLTTAYNTEIEQPVYECFLPDLKPDKKIFNIDNAVRFGIIRFWRNPDSFSKYDIAILELDREITETPSVKAVSIDFKNIVKEGDELIVIGFGVVPLCSVRGFQHLDYLRKGEFKAQNCTRYWSSIIKDEPFCNRIKFNRDQMYPVIGEAGAPILRKKNRKLVAIDIDLKFNHLKDDEFEFISAPLAAEKNKKFIQEILSLPNHLIGRCV